MPAKHEELQKVQDFTEVEMNKSINKANCSEIYPSTAELYSDLKNETATLALLGLCSVFCFITVVIFVEEVWFLVNNYSHNVRRRRILIILALFPVISCSSILSVLVPTATPLTELMAALYLSFCVVQFVYLMTDYFGGSKKMRLAYAGETISFCTPPCCCCCLCLSKIKFSRKVNRTLYIMVVQICVVRPGLLFMVAVLYANGSYNLKDMTSPTSPQIYIKVLNVISTLVGVYGLIVWFKASFTKLNVQRLGLKFGTLKIALLVFDLQAGILSMLGSNGVIPCYGSRGSHVRAIQIHNYFMVLEMFLIGILARFAYRMADDKIPRSDSGSIDLSSELRSFRL